MLSISDILFHYTKSDFNLSIPELKIEKGAKVALVGPSGSGKTTLMRLLAGIYIPDKGKIKFDNVTLNQLNDKQRRDFRIANIGFVFQDFELIEYLNVYENILMLFAAP